MHSRDKRAQTEALHIHRPLTSGIYGKENVKMEAVNANTTYCLSNYLYCQQFRLIHVKRENLV